MQVDPDKLRPWQDVATIHWTVCHVLFCAIGFLSGRPRFWAGNCAPPSHFYHLQHMVSSSFQDIVIWIGWTPVEREVGVQFVSEKHAGIQFVDAKYAGVQSVDKKHDGVQFVDVSDASV